MQSFENTLPKLVDEAQSAFVSNRAIQDNILIAFDMIHVMKNKRSARVRDVAVKIDISKVYDKVDWGFLEYMLGKLGFCVKWIPWIMLCMKSVTYYSFKGFEARRPLITLLRRANREGLLHGSRICRAAPSVPHLLFADDCLFFL